MTDPSSSSDRNPVEELAEEFAERYRRGEKPSLHEYTSRFPDLAEDIRDLFPALVKMEEIRPDAEEAADGGPMDQPVLERIGDYEILREIGHGGMGVVYEAEQSSLQRNVALKVLPPHVTRNSHSHARFQQEARSAARLHHTNIVPVYDVGQEGDLAYYSMQFMRGEGLDQVVEELRMLRSSSQSGRKWMPGLDRFALRPKEVLHGNIARKLLPVRPTASCWVWYAAHGSSIRWRRRGHGAAWATRRRQGAVLAADAWAVAAERAERSRLLR